MRTASYIKLSKNQLNKIGNSLIFLTNRLEGGLTKTKALKLLYILDELSIRKSGIPFFNLKYKVWKFGPVSEEIFVDLSSDTSLLKDYVSKASEEGSTYIVPVAEFSDDEFSDFDMELLEYVIGEFGSKTAKELVKYTHRRNSPWYHAAIENDVLDILDKEEVSNTEILVDMGTLISHDLRKNSIYQDFLEVN